ncbi:single-stranded-DNA-specific exonuclease RecJ [Pseudostreptobacillus hongkongensis]|uniref:single-stranded-DNA-specific exonuclease RecJ n=1 Tax=Pseudostreptobacillus hongkongensis TaxID=1162717 RepID=UPI0028D0527B|nr:single-stranded-DNA-specific exonuclease RecJ [Pseudostreptobacillus hongkongensis]
MWKSMVYDEEYLNDKMKLFEKDKLITTLLLNRKIYTSEDANKFLNSSYKQLHDPFLLDNMGKIVEKLVKYIDTDKNVLIFGDYDIDGISGAVYLSKMFDKLNIKNSIYIPTRTIFKYSLPESFFKDLSKNNIDLIISVDNSFGEVEDIRKIMDLGIDLIITDHHFNNNNVDMKILEINPKKSKEYPFKELSGSGVVFKLVQALYLTLKKPMSEIYEYCELISLATIADVMECVDENRFLIKRGLKNFSKTKILAFKMIIENFKINPEYITINDISYRIAPLINAIGKLDDPIKIIKFLQSESEVENRTIINEMYEYNNERKIYENQLFNNISGYIRKKYKNIKYIYYEINDINLAVLGSITSRVALEFKVPVIMVSRIGKYCKGSCRSLYNTNIYNAISKFSDYFINFGGHDLAAGFLISNSNLLKIRNKLKSALYSLNFESNFEDEITIDMKLSVKSLNFKNIKEISKLGPFGLSNNEPNFYDSDIKFSNILIFGVDNSHFKASIYIGGEEIQVLGYNLSSKLNLKKYNKLYKIIYTPELINKKTIRLKLKDIQ